MMDLDFRRIGDEIETLGTTFCGKITSLGAAGAYEVWRVAPGKVFSGLGRPFRRTPSRLFLVKITGTRAAIEKECKPGAFWAVKRQEFLDEMTEKSGGKSVARAAFAREG